MSIIPPWVKLAAVVLILSMAFGAGWKVKGTFDAAAIKQAEDAAELARQEKAATAARLIEAQSKVETKIVERTKIVYRRISAINGPAQCLADIPDFREVWNDETNN